MNILCVETQCELHYLVKELICMCSPKKYYLILHNIEFHRVPIYTHTLILDTLTSK